MKKRRAATLAEALTALAIFVLLIALLVPAVQRVREAAARTYSMNNLRQIIMAAQGYASANANQLPCYVPGLAVPLPNAASLFIDIIPYCGTDLQLFISPADPTPRELGPGLASYAANGQVFVGQPNLLTSFLDGTSNTIAFAEHYAACGTAEFLVGYPVNNGGARRPTFAEDTDVYPVTNGNPPISSTSSDDPSQAAITFQAAPSPGDCLPNFAQTPHPSGMLVAFADGSVRQLSPSIAPTVYWALVTPAAGDDPGSDW